MLLSSRIIVKHRIWLTVWRQITPYQLSSQLYSFITSLTNVSHNSYAQRCKFPTYKHAEYYCCILIVYVLIWAKEFAYVCMCMCLINTVDYSLIQFFYRSVFCCHAQAKAFNTLPNLFIHTAAICIQTALMQHTNSGINIAKYTDCMVVIVIVFFYCWFLMSRAMLLQSEMWF